MAWLNCVVLATVLVFSDVEANSRIYNGVKAPIHPYMVNLQSDPFTDPATNQSGTVLCGGSLIHPYFVLTAGHCVFSNAYTKEPFADHGFTVFANSNKRAEGAAFKSKKLIPHEEFQLRPTIEHDIALIQLEKPISADLGTPIAMATTVSPNGYDGQKALVMGYGLTNGNHISNELLQGYCTMTDISKCKTTSKSQRLCAITGEKQTHVGEGDSGGPCSIMKDGKPLLIGVNSYYTDPKTTKMDKEEDDFFTDVASYQSWVKSHMVES